MSNHAILDGNSFLYTVCHPNKILNDDGVTYKRDEVTGNLLYTEKSLDDVIYNLSNVLISIFTKLDIGYYLGFLDGKHNFRKIINPSYKSNRIGFVQPKWIEEARQYLINDWGFHRVDCCESDDMCLIHSKFYKDKSPIIVTNDKDLLSTGLSYDWKKDTLLTSTEFEENRFLASQLLTGDTADGVLGAKNIGKVKAEKILSEERVDNNVFPRVLEEYIKIYGLYEGIKNFNITFESLYIRRKLEELPCEGLQIFDFIPTPDNI